MTRLPKALALALFVLVALSRHGSAQTPPYAAWDYAWPDTVTHFRLCVSDVGCYDLTSDVRWHELSSLPAGTFTLTLLVCNVSACTPTVQPPSVTVTCNGSTCVEGGTPPPGPPAPRAATNFHFVGNEPPPPPPPDPTETIQARFSRGQVFITWQESTTPGLTYHVYRSASPIGSIEGLTPIASVPHNSGLNKYTNARFVVTDNGAPLAAGIGLHVHTSKQAGTFYYAVTTSASSAVTIGVNALANPIAEQVWQTPGAVQIAGPEVVGSYNVYKFAAWEDQTTWKPEFGGGWHRFDVAVKAPLSPGVQYPVILDLHGAGINHYEEPSPWVDIDGPGIFIFPVTYSFTQGNTDPYSGRNTWPNWFGRAAEDTPKIAHDVTERRIVRYLDIVKADPRWQVDPTRVHVRGASMGGHGALAMAYHHPNVFASAESSIAYVGPSSWGDWTEFSGNPPVNVFGGVAWENYEDGTWLVQHATTNLPPVIYTFRSGDTIIWPWAWPAHFAALESRKFSYAAHWQDGGHWTYWIGNDHGGNWNFLRFKTNEAYPAFSEAASSSVVASAPGSPRPTTDQGQRNTLLDWSSSLHSFGPGHQIVDESQTFAMSFKSVEGNTTATVTLRNTQAFRPPASTLVTWTNVADGQTIQSGSVLADANGLVTVPGLQIRAGGNRVTWTCASCQVP